MGKLRNQEIFKESLREDKTAIASYPLKMKHLPHAPHTIPLISCMHEDKQN